MVLNLHNPYFGGLPQLIKNCNFAFMSVKQSITKFLKPSLLLLFIGYYSGITLFYHIHIVNGVAVVHSHFYKSESGAGTPIKKHSHPIAAYDLIHELNKISCEELVISMPYQQPLLVPQPIIRYFVSPELFVHTRFYFPSRAPPAC
jgi:hypothetical protein